MQGNHTYVPSRLQSPAFTSDWVVKLRVHVSGPTPLRPHVCSQPGSRLGCGLDDRCARRVRSEADDSSVVEINILLSPVARWAGLNGSTRHRRPFLKQGRAGLHGHSTRERSGSVSVLQPAGYLKSAKNELLVISTNICRHLINRASVTVAVDCNSRPQVRPRVADYEVKDWQ